MHVLWLLVVMPPETGTFQAYLDVTYMMQNVYSVRSLCGFPIMHYVGNKVISCVLLCSLGFFCQVLTKVYIPVKVAT